MAILLSSKPSSLLLLRQNPNPRPTLLPPLSISFPLKPSVKHPLSISLPLKPSVNRPSVAVSSSLVPCPPPPPPSPIRSTISRITALVLAFASFFRSLIQSASSTAHRFFTQLPPGSLRRMVITMGRIVLLYLYIYELFLLMRHYYPELPWHRQPLMTIRDFCDPFLNFSRRVIPPMFGNSDLSAHLGIQLLSTLDLVLFYALISFR